MSFFNFYDVFVSLNSHFYDSNVLFVFRPSILSRILYISCHTYSFSFDGNFILNPFGLFSRSCRILLKDYDGLYSMFAEWFWKLYRFAPYLLLKGLKRSMFYLSWSADYLNVFNLILISYIGSYLYLSCFALALNKTALLLAKDNLLNLYVFLSDLMIFADGFFSTTFFIL